MKILIILIICFLNINCSMNNQEIIDEVNFCKEKNMNSQLLRYVSSGNVYNVICIPLEKE